MYDVAWLLYIKKGKSCQFVFLREFERHYQKKKSVPLQILPLIMAISTLKLETKLVRTKNKNVKYSDYM